MSSFDTFSHEGNEQLRPSDRPFDDGYMGYDPRLSSRRYDSSTFDAGSAHFIGDDDVTVEDVGNPSFSQSPFGDVVPLSNGNGNGIPYDLGANEDEIFDSDGPRFRCRIRCGRTDMISVNGVDNEEKHERSSYFSSANY